MDENKLANANYDLVDYWVKQWDLQNGWDGTSELLDDLRSAAHIGLLNALRSYQSDKETGFRTHASRCIKNAIVDELRHINVRQKYISQFSDIELSEDYDDEESVCTLAKQVIQTHVDLQSPNAEEMLIQKEEERIAKERFIKLLPDLSNRQKYVLYHRIYCEDKDVETLQEIASRFNVHKSTIQREEKKLYDMLSEAHNMS